MKDYIFISYAEADLERIQPIVEKLKKSGYRVWYEDGQNLEADKEEYIANQIAECGCFIAFISENYLTSADCKDELAYAREEDKRRIVIYLDRLELSKGMKMRLAQAQSIHKYSYENEAVFLEKLCSMGLNRCKETTSEDVVELSRENVVELSKIEQKKTDAESDRITIVKEDETKKFRHWREKASDYSNKEAQYTLATMYQALSVRKYVEGDNAECEHYAGLAIQWYWTAMRTRHPDALQKLVDIYVKGIGTDKYSDAAVEVYRQGIREGCVDAFWAMGDVCAERRGDWRSGYSEYDAAAWYEKAMKRSSVIAKYKLANILFEGRGIDTNCERALNLYKRAAKQGCAEAKCKLGDLYATGHRVVEKNYERAIQWYDNAAGQGYAEAQYKLGEIYEKGLGLEKPELEKALELYQKAEKQGYPGAKSKCEKLKKETKKVSS